MLAWELECYFDGQWCHKWQFRMAFYNESPIIKCRRCGTLRNLRKSAKL